MDEIKQNLSDVEDALKNAKNEIKISKQVNSILDGTSPSSGIDSRITKVISSSPTDVIPVYVKTFANYTGTQDIGVDSFVTRSDDGFTAILDKSQIESLAQSGYVGSITLPHLPEVSSISQGVTSSYADTLHNANITGSGVTVAVIDDSFVLSDPKLNASSITHSALYDSVGFCGGDISCKKTQGNSHGTATAGIIADMAPDASLQLYAIASSADFENAIYDIIARGDADIISVSLAFPTLGGDGTTGYFRDGTSSVARAVNDAKDAGILVAVASGNDAKRHWSGTYNVSAVSPNSIGLANYTGLIEFQPTVSEAHNACLPVSHGGWTVTSWDSWEYTSLDYDVFLFDGTMSNILSSSTVPQSLVAGAPIEIIYGPPIPDTCIVVALSDDSDAPPDSSLIHINTIRGSIRDGLAMVQSSLTTPADARGATTVGAVNHVDNTVESFSSAGPTDDNRDKPEICGFDGVSSNQGSFNPFLGTSAAAPHVAGAAAVLMQAYPQNSTQQIANAMLASAGASSDPNLCGAGILSLQRFSDNTDINGNYTGGNDNGPGNTNGKVSGGSEIPLITVGTDSILIQSITALPTHGTAQITSDGTEIQYSPNLNYHGTDSFVYNITDNFGETSTATVSIDVTPVNDAPFITPIIDYTILVQTSLSFTAIAVDADTSDVLTFSLLGAPAGALIDPNTGAFTWTPTESQNGRHTITIRVSDTTGSFASQTFMVTVGETADVDTVAPEIASILRSNPVDSATSETTLVFEIVFSEPVLGVNQTDFVLSFNGTASNSVESNTSNQTSSPGLAIPYSVTVSDTINVPGSGNVTSVSVDVDITHGYIGDLLVELVAPNGESVTLHNRSGGSVDDIDQTYTPVFGNIGSGGDWVLRINDNYDDDSGVLNEWTLTVNYDTVSAANPITGLDGSGSRYLVTALASQGEGTYRLTLVDDSGIMDAAENLLTNTNSTGPNQSYTVTLLDTTAPEIASILRSNPVDSATSETTLVFEIVFSEPVLGVNQTDFVLSSNGTASNSVESNTSNQTSSPGLAIPYSVIVSDTINVPGSGNVTSVSVDVDITHGYIGDLLVELVAPNGESVTLHNRSGGSVDDIDQTYTPVFGNIGSGGDWVLRINDNYDDDSGVLNEWTLTVNYDTVSAANPITGLDGSGSRYLVTALASQGEGTYNLDVVPGEISDLAGNPLSNVVPTGADESYAVTATSSDVTMPTITAPDDVTVEATGLLTLVSIGNATATDDVDPNPIISNDAPPSFPPGSTIVTWTATDSSDNSSTVAQLVTIRDTTSPSFDLAPANISRTFASGATTTVSFNIPVATDLADAVVDVSCTPQSGSTFSTGDTTVSCTATDDSDNFATVSFTVSVTIEAVSLSSPEVLEAKTTDSEVILTWYQPVVGSPIGYHVLRDSGFGLSVLVNDTQSTDVSYIDRSVSPGASYSYQVKAVTADGLSLPSNLVNATVRQAGILDMWAATTHNSTTVGWNYSGDATRYVVDQTDGIDSASGPSIWFLGNDTHTITDDGLSMDDAFVYHLYVEVNNTYPDYDYYDFVEVIVGQTNVTDITAPTVSSIARYDPVVENTNSQTLIYNVTFSEDVTGVDVSDFVMHTVTSDGTIITSGPLTGFDQFTQTRSPALAITQANTITDTIAVTNSGNATSVSLAVDVSHTYISDLKIDLIAPDDTTKIVHNRSGGSADDIDQTYTPDFTGVSIAGTWTLRINDDYAAADDGILNSWTLTINSTATTGTIANLSGSNSTYNVTVSAVQEGTHDLNLTSSGHGITDTAGNPLTDHVPTGADHTYTVDLTAPTISSIERFNQSNATTGNQTLIYSVTFSEDVTGVDASDFVLSSNSTGRIGSSQFTYTSTPSLDIIPHDTDKTDTITVSESGTVSSVSVDVDITHPWRGDLLVQLISPDNQIVTLHNRVGGSADNIVETYILEYGDDVSISGDWQLRMNDNYYLDSGVLNSWTLTLGNGINSGPITSLTGSGSQYLATVSASRDGTYNLDLVPDHGITDAVGNPLTDAVPIGVDETYTVSTS